jgi:hypothetical protein
VRTRLAAVLLALATALWLAPSALAHSGLVGKRDLPIPEWLFGWAAALVLIVSFAALAVLWPEPRLQEPRRRPLFRLPGWIEVLTGAVGVALFVLVVYAGLTGSQKPTENLAPTAVYVYFWVGLVVLSVLLGDVFRAFNPWLAIARGVAWVAGRVAPGGLPAPLPYPARLGRWPAVVGILAFAWVELAYVHRNDPSTLSVLALGYAAVQLAGMSLYGIESWSRRADAFGVYFGLFARIAPLERRDGVVHARTPLAGLTGLAILPGTVALLCVAIGSTTFDGFSNSTVWANLRPDLQSPFEDLGLGRFDAIEAASTLGLLACVGLVALLYRLGVWGMQTAGEGHSARELAQQFVYTLVPIAFAYALAHYFSLLVFQGQTGPRLVANTFEDVSRQVNPDYGVIRATGVWYVQVGALVAGHVAGLTLAHDKAVALYRNPRAATRSQLYMLGVMVAFTSLGLWLLSAVQQ